MLSNSSGNVPSFYVGALEGLYSFIRPETVINMSRQSDFVVPLAGAPLNKVRYSQGSLGKRKPKGGVPLIVNIPPRTKACIELPRNRTFLVSSAKGDILYQLQIMMDNSRV